MFAFEMREFDLFNESFSREFVVILELIENGNAGVGTGDAEIFISFCNFFSFSCFCCSFKFCEC